MQKITIHNFLTLKDISITVANITIIIGHQGEGKSLLAKLLYFFKDFTQDFHKSIARGDDKWKFDASITTKFSTIFPPYTWEGTEFRIEYFYNSQSICIYSKILDQSTALTMEYSDEAGELYSSLKETYSAKFENCEGKEQESLNFQLENEICALFCTEEENTEYIERAIFIPAGRAFFSTMEKKMWSFLSHDTTIYYFLEKFGTSYEQVKSFYHHLPIIDKTSFADANKYIQEFLRGEYRYEKNLDRIYYENKKINLSNSSSGQQEVLPMSVLVTVFGLLYKNFPHYFLIEEPEAHLFPASQKAIVELVSLIYNINKGSRKFFITTHGLFILTAFNNSIQAHNSYLSIKGNKEEIEEEKKDILLKKLFNIVPQNQMIPFEDIAVYSVHDGYLKDLKNYEDRLIYANEIDDIYTALNKNFSDLLDLELESL
ncbi:MAG: ATP-binding protein [bacterium]|nr:ATP-binding protein [bacterium]